MRNYLKRWNQRKAEEVVTAELVNRAMTMGCAETEAKLVAKLGPNPSMYDIMELWSAWERGNG